MEIVIEYKIVTGANAQTLEDAVNVQLRKGWMLLGTPFVRTHELCQCLIKRNVKGLTDEVS